MPVTNSLNSAREILIGLVGFNGIAGIATLRRESKLTLLEEPQEEPQLPATHLALGASAIFLVGAGSLVGLALATFGIDVVASFLFENIATTAGVSLVAGMCTAGLIDFVSRMHAADKSIFSDEEEYSVRDRCITTALSCTFLPSLFLLLSHAILFTSALIQALVLTVSPYHHSKEAWTEVSENFRALSFNLGALLAIPLVNIVDLLGRSLVKECKEPENLEEIEEYVPAPALEEGDEGGGLTANRAGKYSGTFFPQGASGENSTPTPEEPKKDMIPHDIAVQMWAIKYGVDFPFPSHLLRSYPS